MVGRCGSSGGGRWAAGAQPPASRAAMARTGGAADRTRRMPTSCSSPFAQVTLGAEPHWVAIAHLDSRSLFGGTRPAARAAHRQRVGADPLHADLTIRPAPAPLLRGAAAAATAFDRQGLAPPARPVCVALVP